MKKIIYYFLYDENENKSYNIHNENIIMYIIKGDKTYLTTPRCGSRAHIIYLEKSLNTKSYQDWIDTCLKPMTCLPNSEGIIFI